MKTQIKYLISGRKDVIIDETNAKYDNANKSTSHNGFAGTNKEERTIKRQVLEYLFKHRPLSEYYPFQ